MCLIFSITQLYYHLNINLSFNIYGLPWSIFRMQKIITYILSIIKINWLFKISLMVLFIIYTYYYYIAHVQKCTLFKFMSDCLITYTYIILIYYYHLYIMFQFEFGTQLLNVSFKIKLILLPNKNVIFCKPTYKIHMIYCTYESITKINFQITLRKKQLSFM